MPISSPEIVSNAFRGRVHLLPRNYFIDLAQSADHNWVVTKIIHSLTGVSVLPPGFNYTDHALAEQYARAAVDMQLSAE